MKARVSKDRRSDIDRKFDLMWNGMVLKAKLTPKQSQVVAKYLHEIMGMRIHEIESGKDMAWMLSLIRGEKFGTNPKRGAVRLTRTYNLCADILNEAYGHGCIDANGFWQSYDGCGLEYLKEQLAKHNVDYDTCI